ncbi:hypothetical protein GGF32_002852 [Allomyces javanicus]|nr:hypothetical protein GGF32_002852 [Allomyces javanicus]
MAPARDQLLALLDAVRTAKHPTSARLLSKLFAVLPSRTAYPDYYQIIAKPISLREIKAKIDKRQYPTLAALKADLDLMLANCKKYNVPGSDIYRDAVLLAKILNDAFKELSRAAPSTPVSSSSSRSRRGSAANATALPPPAAAPESSDLDSLDDDEFDSPNKEDAGNAENEDDQEDAADANDDAEPDQNDDADAMDEDAADDQEPPPPPPPPTLASKRSRTRSARSTTAAAAPALEEPPLPKIVIKKRAATPKAAPSPAAPSKRAAASRNDGGASDHDEPPPSPAPKRARRGLAPPPPETPTTPAVTDNAPPPASTKRGPRVRTSSGTAPRATPATATASASAPEAMSPHSPSASASAKRSKKARTDALAWEDVRMLNTAMEKGKLKTIQALFERKTDVPINVLVKAPAAVSETGFTWTPLHMAAYYGHNEVVDWLMEQGADVEAKDTWYEGTALAWAAYMGHAETCKLLVKKYGADPHSPNSSGQIPIDLVSDPNNAVWADIFPPEPAEAPRPKRGRATSGAKKMTAAPSVIGQRMHAVLRALEAATDRSGRHLAEAFAQLPSREEYPDYYDAITNPISLAEIRGKVRSLAVAAKEYTVVEFRADLVRMCENAMEYNEEQSQIFRDAVALLDLVKREVRQCDDHLVAPLESVLIADHPVKVGHFAVMKDDQIVLIERAGKNAEGEIIVQGTLFLHPNRVRHARSLYPSEVFKSDFINVPARYLVRPCLVVWVRDLAKGLPIGYPYDSIYLCESKQTPKSLSVIKDWAKEFTHAPIPVPAYVPPFPLTLTKTATERTFQAFIDACTAAPPAADTRGGSPEPAPPAAAAETPHPRKRGGARTRKADSPAADHGDHAAAPTPSGRSARTRTRSGPSVSERGGRIVVPMPSGAAMPIPPAPQQQQQQQQQPPPPLQQVYHAPPPQQGAAGHPAPSQLAQPLQAYLGTPMAPGAAALGTRTHTMPPPIPQQPVGPPAGVPPGMAVDPVTGTVVLAHPGRTHHNVPPPTAAGSPHVAPRAAPVAAPAAAAASTPPRRPISAPIPPTHTPRLLTHVYIEYPGRTQVVALPPHRPHAVVSVPRHVPTVRVIPVYPPPESVLTQLAGRTLEPGPSPTDPLPFGIAMLKAGKQVYGRFTTDVDAGSVVRAVVAATGGAVDGVGLQVGPVFDTPVVEGCNVFELWATAQPHPANVEVKQLQTSYLVVNRV